MLIYGRGTNPQFRMVNVGMFSGPRPSYQRYSIGPLAAGSLNRTGV